MVNRGSNVLLVLATSSAFCRVLDASDAVTYLYGFRVIIRQDDYAVYQAESLVLKVIFTRLVFRLSGL
jgi:hypothetical protein